MVKESSISRNPNVSLFWEIHLLECTKRCLISYKSFSEHFFALKSSHWSKNRKNIALQTIFSHYHCPKQNFEILGHPVVITPLLFQTDLSTSICSWWLSSFRTSKAGYESFLRIKNEMKMSKLLFGMINNKTTCLFRL